MKSLRLILILLTAGVAGYSPAVTQNDVVGYWTHTFQPGFNLVAFPVLPDTPTLQSVIGDKLGAVEISTYDPQIRTYRRAKFDQQTGQWQGNLYLLSRGVAFWVYIPGNDSKNLIVTGHPEVYTKFRWSQLRFGWQFYAPTYGKAENLNDLPPLESRDLIIDWNPITRRFGLAEATIDLIWRSSQINRFAPDKAYIALLHHQPPRQVGPPLEIESLYERHAGPIALTPDEGDGYHKPPEPIIVGNLAGLAVCKPSGEPCNGSMIVRAYRERAVTDGQGGIVIVNDYIGEYTVATDLNNAGRFNIALTLGGEPGMLQTGDRIVLVVRDGQGGETRSTSFEIPIDERIIDDVSFTETLASPETAFAPIEFGIGSPFPNPFNDRFSLEIRLPEFSPVSLDIFDIAGRQAFEMNIPLGTGVHRLNVPAGGIPAGVYLVQVTAGSHRGLLKVAHLK